MKTAKAQIRRVVDLPCTTRYIFYNNRKVQVSVLTFLNDLDTGRVTDMILSVPIEGKGGWSIRPPSFEESQTISNRECSKLGKLYNRIVTIPVALLRGNLT